MLSQQAQEWQRRAAQLDQDNQDLESRLAQSLQQLNLLKEEVVATRDQLRSTTQQLKASLAENDTLKQRAHIEELDPAFEGLPIVRQMQERKLNCVLSNSFGFGGTNATLAFTRLAA